VALADIQAVGAGPSTTLKVYFLKKSFDFCDDGLGRDMAPGDIQGGSVPDGFDVQSSGCVDRWVPGEFRGNDGLEQGRVDNYAFTGEQIAELVVARDLSGAAALTTATINVDSDAVAYCSAVDISSICKAPDAAHNWKYWGCSWKGHVGTDFDGLMNEYPPQESGSIPAGYTGDFDKLFKCLLTVTDAYKLDSYPVTVTVNDVNGNTATTDPQTWYFNPEVSIMVDTSDGEAITFGVGHAGDLVYSINSLTLKNMAEGGVDIAVWLGGTDLSSPDMTAKCPVSNILDVEGTNQWPVVDGMAFRCTLDNGVFGEQYWQQVENKNIKEECEYASAGFPFLSRCLELNPLFFSHSNVLENGHEASCIFKLKYPVPCIGEFTEGNLIILMRAI